MITLFSGKIEIQAVVDDQGFYLVFPVSWSSLFKGYVYIIVGSVLIEKLDTKIYFE